MAMGSAPDSLSEHSASVAAQYASNRGTYTDLVEAVRGLITTLVDARVQGAEISGRAKEVVSVQGKVDRKKYSSLDDISDLAGIRVIVQTLGDVEVVAEMLEKEFEPLEIVDHGPGQKPDSFGYSSRHLVLRLRSPRVGLEEWTRYSGIRFEVQVRTILQHAWASISHALDYKIEAAVPGDVRRKLFQVAALIEVGDGLFEAFRGDLRKVQGKYEAIASEAGWRLLPIDLDSLIATWDEWRPTWADNLVPSKSGITLQRGLEEGLRAGRQTGDEDSVELLSPNLLSRIVLVSNVLDLSTVGALCDLLGAEGEAQISQYFDGLSRLPFYGVFTYDFIALAILLGVALDRGLTVPADIEYVWAGVLGEIEKPSPSDAGVS